jgi:hypothetical protein
MPTSLERLDQPSLSSSCFHANLSLLWCSCQSHTPVGSCCLQSSMRPICLNAASLSPSYCSTCHLINAASLPSYHCGVIAILSLRHHCQLINAASSPSFCGTCRLCHYSGCWINMVPTLLLLGIHSLNILSISHCSKH